MLGNRFKREKTCRTCTKSDLELSSLFDKLDSPEGVCYSEMIKECTTFSVLNDKEFPPHICVECINKVRVAYNFKKQCEESHRKLLELIEELKKTPSEQLEGEETSQFKTIPERASTRSASFKRISSKVNQCLAKEEKVKEDVISDHRPLRHTCPECSREFIRMGHLTRHINKCHKKEETSNEKEEIEKVVVKAEIDYLAIPDNTSEDSTKPESDAEDTHFDLGTADDDFTYSPQPEALKTLKVEPEISPRKLKTDDKLPTTDNETKKENVESVIKQESTRKRKLKGVPVPERRYQCEQCKKSFKRNSHLKQHFLIHTQLKPYECDICQRKFSRMDNLRVHMSNHGKRQFKCDLCDRSFGQAYQLKRHKDHTHSEEKPFLCSECGQRFCRNGDLAIHMRRHKGEKPFKCRYCDKGFTRSTEVYVHERYHTGEKNHVCTICGKAFQRPYNLVVHVRTHTGERPYKCPHCPKSFAQCSDLKSHIRRHTGERYRCDQCAMGFIHAFLLNQHKRNVHGIEVPSRIKRINKPNKECNNKSAIVSEPKPPE